MALYSASAELLETVTYFFDFHEIRDSPYLIKYPVIDFLLLIHEPQSASQNTCKLFPPVDDIRIPKPGSVFKYLTSLSAEFMCEIFGACIN